MATLSDLYTHLKTLCEQWFYNKSTVDTYLNNKVDKENGKGLSTNDYTTAEKTKLSGIEAEANKTTVDSALSSTSTNPLQNKAINTALSSKADSSDIPTKTSDLTNDGADGTNVYIANNDSRLSDARTPLAHNQASSTITEASALSNIGTSASATQHTVNTAIDSAIGNLSSIQAIQVVSTLPTASSSTMGSLYIVNEDSKVNVYYTEQSGSSYSWHKMDTDILDELSVGWSDIKNKPSTFTPSSHTHGNINNDGTINSSPSANFSTVNYPLVRDSTDNGKIKIGLVPTNMVRSNTAYSNIGSSANVTQNTINTAIDTAIGNINTSLNNKASSSHTHNNITNDGKVTVTGTNGGNLVVTNTNNAVVVESVIDVMDGVVQSLISYGNS